ncbi:MAG: Mrp/NBP35 family ATP-binding protein [Dehalococcoidia bacterium]|nr:Mrp/NBP35 family ATP-binding protein [Dehalococcoidia bacterium]
MSVDMKNQVREALEQVLVPEVMRSVVQMNLVRDVEVAGGAVKVTLASTAMAGEIQNTVREMVMAVVGKVPGVTGTTVDFVEAKPKEINQIGKVIAVMSGKGGVGKSLVTGLLAIFLARSGKSVGILDADVTGSSIPKMFGLKIHPRGSESGIVPVLSRSGIETMAMNVLLDNEDDAVIWRGPLMSKVITQFWEEVLWGKLDYLVVDLPPGTGDAALTVMQTIPLTGVIEVFTPQDLTEMIVMKAVKMAQKMNVHVLGVVENMSYLVLPDSGKKMEVFGPSKAGKMAEAAGAPLLGVLPIEPEVARLCDAGDIEKYDSDAAAELFKNIIAALNDKDAK